MGGTGITSLSGLQNINTFAGDLKFEYNTNLSDFCAINGIINEETSLITENNAYNPTVEDILAGNCSE